MTPEVMFLKTVAEIAARLSSGDYYDLIKASGLLRQLFLDENALVHQANRQTKCKLLFRLMPACDLGDDLEPRFHLHDISVPGLENAPGIQLVKLDAFLSTKCGSWNGIKLNVKDIIKACANVRGGVHVGIAKSDEERALVSMDEVFEFGGQNATQRMLSGIARVAIQGLQPLVNELSHKHGKVETADPSKG